jgi:protein O-GlcNAc transferase
MSFAAGSLARSAARFSLAAVIAVGLLGTGACAAAPPADTAAGSPPIPNAVRAEASGGNAAPLAAYVAAHPGDRAAALLLGDVYVRIGNAVRAEAVYRSIAADGADRELHDWLGNVLALEDRVDDAIAEFEKALPDVAAFGDLVRLHKRRGDLAAFVESYRIRADGNPLDAASQFGYGVVLHDLRQPARALPYLVTALHDAPPGCPTLTAIGSVELDLDRPGPATDSFRRCLSIDPNDYAALVDLSDTYGPEGYDEARRLLDRAFALRPSRPEAIVDLGYLDDRAGNVDAAIARYDAALSVDPFFRDAYVDLGFAYNEAGRYQLAERTCLRGLGVSRDDGRIAYILATTFERQGKRDLAAREYRVAIGSDEPEIAAAAKEDLATYL